MKILLAIRCTLYALLLAATAWAQYPHATYNREHPENMKNGGVLNNQIVLAQDSLPPDSLIKIFDLGGLQNVRKYLKTKGFKYKHKPQFVGGSGRRRGGYTDKPTFTSHFFKIYIYLYENDSYSVNVAYKPSYYRPAAMQAYMDKFASAGFIKQDSSEYFSQGTFYADPNERDILLVGPYPNNGQFFSLVFIPADTVSTLHHTAADILHMATCPGGYCLASSLRPLRSSTFDVNENVYSGYANADKIYQVDNYTYKLNVTAIDSSYLHLSLTTTNIANYDSLRKGFANLGFVTTTPFHIGSQLLNWEDVYQSAQYPGVTLVMGARTYYSYAYQTHYYINLRRGKQ